VITPDTRRAIEAVWREEAPKIVGALTRHVRDLGLAEDLAHDALVAALEQWPAEGIPRNPGAWLMTAAKRRGIDLLRRRTRLARTHAALAHELEAASRVDAGEVEAAMDDDIRDDVLRLMFVACHPVLSSEARVALTLRLVGGLTTAEIARAFVVPEPTVAQRLVRAKRTLARAGVPFEVPRGDERLARLASVLDVVILVFNEGYAATGGGDHLRPPLCDDARRVGRLLATLMPDEPEVHAAVALMEYQASRQATRVDADGDIVRLADQDRSRWDRAAIARADAALARAEALGGQDGRLALQAAIAACHARAASTDATDWHRIAALYARLVHVTGSPVVRLNHAVAVAMASGPAAAFALVEALRAEGALASYHYALAVRADLLERLGRLAEARDEFERAATLTANARERALLLDRARACAVAAG
jgi:RNA polymerase sigma-70 factor (ECF subfamily)